MKFRKSGRVTCLAIVAAIVLLSQSGALGSNAATFTQDLVVGDALNSTLTLDISYPSDAALPVKGCTSIPLSYTIDKGFHSDSFGVLIYDYVTAKPLGSSIIYATPDVATKSHHPAYKLSGKSGIKICTQTWTDKDGTKNSAAKVGNFAIATFSAKHDPTIDFIYLNRGQIPAAPIAEVPTNGPHGSPYIQAGAEHYPKLIYKNTAVGTQASVFTGDWSGLTIAPTVLWFRCVFDKAFDGLNPLGAGCVQVGQNSSYTFGGSDVGYFIKPWIQASNSFGETNFLELVTEYPIMKK
jgi:hypothetical protein